MLHLISSETTTAVGCSASRNNIRYIESSKGRYLLRIHHSIRHTMARLAGLPARFVSGYTGGSWTGNGYEVYGSDTAQWGEVRLEMTAGSGGDDLGWIPF